MIFGFKQHEQWAAAARRSRSPRRRGDHLQRSSAAHLYDWAIGESSVCTLKRHCRNTVRDDVARGCKPDAATVRLSRIGGVGSKGQNCHRALMNALKHFGMDYSCFITSVPRGHQFKLFIKPHLFLHWLSSEFPEYFHVQWVRMQTWHTDFGAAYTLRPRDLLSGKSMSS